MGSILSRSLLGAAALAEGLERAGSALEGPLELLKKEGKQERAPQQFLRKPVIILRSVRPARAGPIDLTKGHQPAGKKAGVQGQTQGLSQGAKDALARALGMPAAPQA